MSNSNRYLIFQRFVLCNINIIVHLKLCLRSDAHDPCTVDAPSSPEKPLVSLPSANLHLHFLHSPFSILPHTTPRHPRHSSGPASIRVLLLCCRRLFVNCSSPACDTILIPAQPSPDPNSSTPTLKSRHAPGKQGKQAFTIMR
jgi:hypothetical protein